jgi:hypothetical protein
LTRLLVKARVTDLEDVQRHIVFSKSEGFLGQSWTIQREVMSQNLLGGQPQDEDAPPLDDPFNQPEPPFDFFGLGQQAHPTPFFDAPEQLQPKLAARR